MNMLRYITLVFALVLLAFASRSQVVINEFSMANYSGIGGMEEDWVEFYNPTGAAVNIGGYYLSDDAANPTKWLFPATASVPANGYLVVLLSGAGDYDPNFAGYLNTTFKVTQTNGEDLVFSNTSGTILESYDFAIIGPNQADQSWARTTNGGPDWRIHTSPTLGAGNSGTTGTTYASTPVFSQQAGYYASAVSVSITSDANTTIRYTTDGSEPTATSTLYAAPINISTTTSLRAKAFSGIAGILPSSIETNSYFFGADLHEIMVVNISGGTLSDGSWGWGGGNGELTHIEFFTAGGTFWGESFGDSNEHGNDSNAYGQRGFDYISRDQLGVSDAIALPVFSLSDRQEYQRLIFKAAANDNYPFSGDGAHIRDAYVCQLSLLGDLKLDERKTESCIVYINGDYWGVYEAREKVDDTDYTREYYDQPEGFVDFIKTWGGTWDEYGSSTDWNTLVNFITTNDMTVQANYDYVLTQYNTISLIDYFILNGYTVCTDWLNWNTAWWRGRHPNGEAKRWRYALWDNDATFGHYVNYTGVPSTDPSADPCQIDGMGDVGGQGHIPVLNALFDNEQFFADYINRYAQLSNGIFSCDRMIEVLDSMIAVIDPEMTRQCQRWGGTYAGWQANVQTMRDFILDRCNSSIITGIEDCYDVTAFTVTVQIDGPGSIDFSNIVLDENNSPWTGTFFGDIPINILALSSGTAGSCGSFTGWEIVSGTGTIVDPLSDTTQFEFTSDVTLVAHFSEPALGAVTILTDVSPVGAGVITIDGTTQVTYPQSTTQAIPGTLMTLEITPNDWFTFDNWTSVNSILLPDDGATEITLKPCLSDTVIAVFTSIPHFELTVNISPALSGSVLMNGTPITGTLPWITVLEGGLDYTFTAVTSDIWTVFDHWEINGNSISPDEFSATVLLSLIENGSITAVFYNIPHHTITVMVDPPYTGLVSFDNYSTETELTLVLKGDTPFVFTAAPYEYQNFVKWTSLVAGASPDPKSKEVTFVFTAPDTIVAHFEEEPFQVFIPNSFTPNNDGINDYFRPTTNAADPESYHLMVFNRWGEKVFETADIDQVWEGDFKGGQYYLPDMVYTYYLKIKSVHNTEPKEYSGAITIFR